MRIAVLFTFLATGAVAQDVLPVLRPTLGTTPDLAPGRVALFAEYDSLLYRTDQMTADGEARYDTLSELLGDSDGPCDVIGIGCSWYCGGGPDTIWASSTLRSNPDHDYEAANAHDLSYCTAWCEGAPGKGVGESLIYHFAKDSPRLHTIFVSNGLATNEAAWRAHNRVKRLRVAENGSPFVDLDLEDVMDDQRFDLPSLLGKRADGEPMLLTFTILEVYRGVRSNDTVITEIWFDGIDVH